VIEGQRAGRNQHPKRTALSGASRFAPERCQPFEQYRLPRQFPGRRKECAHRQSVRRHAVRFADGIDAARRGNECRPLGDKTVLTWRARLQELGGDDHINIAGVGVEREDQLAAAERRQRLVMYFQIIGSGTRALRDAGNGRALHRQAGKRRAAMIQSANHATASPPSAR